MDMWKRCYLKRLVNLGLLMCLGLTIALLPSAAVATLPQQPSSTVTIIADFPKRSDERDDSPFLLAADADALLTEGIRLYQAEQFAEAINLLQQATTLGDAYQQSLAWNYISLAAQKLGQWQQATTAVATSLSLIPASYSDNADGYRLLARVLTTRGHLELATGQPIAALDTWKQAEKAYDRANYPIGATGSLINQAQALQTQGLYRQAFLLLTSANQRLQQQPDSLLKVTTLQSLGNSLRILGDLPQSQRVLTDAVTIAKTLQNPNAIAQSLLSLGATLEAQADGVLALTAIRRDRRSQALQNQQASLATYQQAAAIAQTPRLKAQATLSQFNLWTKTPDRSAALTISKQLHNQLAALPASRFTIYAYLQWAQGLTTLMTTPEASQTSWLEIAQIIGHALQQAKTLQDSRAESYALGSLGHVYEQTEQWAEARNLTQLALLQAQVITANDLTYRWQWQLGRLFKATGKPTQAVSAYAQAITILKTLRQDLAVISPDAQFSFRDSVEPLYRDYVALLLSVPSTPNSSATDIPQNSLVLARDTIESLQLAELEDFFRQACLDVAPVQIDQVDATAAVVYPIILPDRVDVILSLPNQPLRHQAIPVLQTQVEQTLKDLRRELINQESTAFLPLAQQIYNWVIRPALSDLSQHSIKTLVFVLDGRFRDLPIAALHDGQRYLVEDYAVAVAPSLQLVDVKPLKREQLSVLLAGLSQSRLGFSSLPSVETELTQISQQLTHQLLLNEAFSSRTLEQALINFSGPIVHLATHGEFSSNPEDTFILTWDKQLTITELADLLQQRNLKQKQAVELLVLSACRTAIGDNRATLGLAGMAVRAGARTTIGSLWYVSDEATTTLMIALYQKLANKSLPKAEALRQAQLVMIKRNNYQHPYFWAPFILVGNWL